ncbi:hypothetical protein ACE7GA_26975 (plasmid) [Roseomonas sp. CCTCC AB2023176]|uniref:hypothetical protein n=1 Tax=Roseomonas sp. CCTCC AB2023176 TaxID=3342640 RepID=UPI0035D86B9B
MPLYQHRPPNTDNETTGRLRRWRERHRFSVRDPRRHPPRLSDAPTACTWICETSPDEDLYEIKPLLQRLESDKRGTPARTLAEARIERMRGEGGIFVEAVPQGVVSGDRDIVARRRFVHRPNAVEFAGGNVGLESIAGVGREAVGEGTGIG